MEAIRFIHTADLHLGSPFTGMKGLGKEQWKKLKDSTFEAFSRLIDYAVEEQPDFLLIAGDIYDGEDRNIRAQHRFQQGMQRLHEAGIPVVLSYGNHDHLSGNWPRFELPENVRSLGPEVSEIRLQTKKGEVAVNGFSYGERHVKKALIHDYPPAEDGSIFHIGILHGSMDGNLSHAVYAPFTKEQLLGKNYDYWALGHIHMRQELHQNPSIVYPGNLQGRHRNEAGSKGFYDVSLSKQDTELRFVPASVIQFDRIAVDCSGIMHMNELIDACTGAVSLYIEQNGAAIAELQFTRLDAGSAELLEDIAEDELLETIRESLDGSGQFVWVTGIDLEKTTSNPDLSPLGEKIIGAMSEWDSIEWKTVLKDLYRHPKGSRFLEPLDEEMAEKICQDAVSKIRLGMKVEE